MRDVRGVTVVAVFLLIICSLSSQTIYASEAVLERGDQAAALAAYGKSAFLTVIRLRPKPDSQVDTSSNNVVATTGTSDTSSAFIVRNSGTTELFRVRSDGNVGIGTTTPSQKLHVAGQYAEVEFNSGASSSPATIFLAHSRGSVGSPTNLVALDYAGTFLFGAYMGVGYVNAGRIDSLVTATGSSSVDAALIFSPASVNNGNFEVMRISASGNVGIGGVTNPSHKLEVVGDANFSGTVTGGNIVAKYQDLAEWVPASEELEPSTVVVLRPGKEVAASTFAYDTKVAGVVSAQPGITLGEGAPNKIKVATTGRVRVRVDATRHSIAVGDLLVTSDLSGTAMYSEPIEIAGAKIHRPGTIIGKALEPLSAGQGEILVLLSLQ